MKTFEIGELQEQRQQQGRLYLEFLKSRLSARACTVCGLEKDNQQPHTEDEVYYVVSGRASFAGGDKQYPVQAGSVLFVEANLEHRFFDIVEDLNVLVFFAPAEYSLKS